MRIIHLTEKLYLMVGNLYQASYLAREVRVVTGVGLPDVQSHKVCQAGEFGRHLAKLTELGHEGGSGAGSKVDDERSAWLAPAEERDHTPGLQVVQLRAGGSGAFLGLLQNISHRIGEPFLKLGYQ